MRSAHRAAFYWLSLKDHPVGFAGIGADWRHASFRPGIPGPYPVGYIDPRSEREYVDSISDKARAIGGGVLEAMLHS